MGLIKNLFVRIKGDKTDLDNTLKGSESSIASWSKKIGGFFAAAFSVGAIISFGKHLVELASRAEGVRAAFQRLDAPGLLEGLRAATRGTVTDVQLMQKAVQAQNFKIPLSQLATYFEFATKRAIQTGESVDYLVDSIITGIGRKSVLVMDNLGISAVQLQEEVKKTGDFATAAGNIIRSELTSMGDVADTTATKVASIKTAFENLKTGLGFKITESPVFQGIVNWFSNVGKFAQVPGVSLIQAIYGATIEPKAFNDILDESNKKLAENASALLKQREAAKAAGQGRGSIIAAPSQGTFGQLKVPGISGLEGAQGLQPFNAVLERDVSKMEEILTTARDMAVNYGSEIVEALGEALTGGNLDDIGKSLLMSLANFLSQFGKMLIVMGLGIEAYVKSLATLNPFMAVAAGVAMLLAAGAIKGIISRQSSSVSSGRMGGGSGGYGGQAAGQMKVVIEGKLVGRDIYWSNKRYETDLNSGT